MKTKAFLTYILALGLLVPMSVSAQSAKKILKTGQEFEAAKNYEDAIKQYDKAIELDADYVDAYAARANAYEQIYKINEAIADYVRASTFDPDNAEYYFHLGDLYYKLDQYLKAIEYANKAIEREKKYIEAMQVKARAQIALEQYTNAIATADDGLAAKKGAEMYYLHGKASRGMKDFSKAEYDFQRAIFYDQNHISAYVELSEVQVELNKKDEAMASCNKGLKIHAENDQLLLARSRVYKSKLDYPNAINDASKALLMTKTKAGKIDVYNIRGTYYKDFGQPQAAVNDFTQVLLEDKSNFRALYSRAAAYEDMHEYEKAIEDYESLRKLSPYDSHAALLLDQAAERLYELNRESENPVVVLLEPVARANNMVPIPKNQFEATIKAKVNDGSKIKEIKVNGKNVEYDKTVINPDFTFTVRPQEMAKFEIYLKDDYNNEVTYDYAILTTEIDTPVVKLIAPYASDDGEIYLDNNNSSLYIEGKIIDESLIKSIQIEGATASFMMEQRNPTFSATINISNKKYITVTAEDAYGNVSNKKFKFNREGALIAANNPMGKTWVVFIENSNYTSFASLEGPSKDVRTMKSALANYQIHNVIRKRDMSKSDFERFFSIELRDLVRSNKVNSILVWYAGHGKFLNETGYWIPVDAKRDDEFTYFNINSLKAAMQSYSKYITHTLVITDACESGPSFYQAMRSTGESRSCDDWEATRFKSSQVFSSAGYELASDNSQFTKTFANSLMNNPDACIPIDKIVDKVTEAVSKNASQKPKFGKIAGLEDENGTFFFMKR